MLGVVAYTCNPVSRVVYGTYHEMQGVDGEHLVVPQCHHGNLNYIRMIRQCRICPVNIDVKRTNLIGRREPASLRQAIHNLLILIPCHSSNQSIILVNNGHKILGVYACALVT